VFLGRLSLLLLLAACSATPATGAPLTSPTRFTTCGIERPTAPRFVAPALSTARPYSLSRFSPWRYRLKSVLPEADSWITRESDLGPVPLLDRFYSSVVQTRRLDLSPTAIPLRC
jgi:hypothetical protein